MSARNTIIDWSIFTAYALLFLSVSFVRPSFASEKLAVKNQVNFENMMRVSKVLQVVPSPQADYIAWTATRHIKNKKKNRWEDSTQIYLTDMRSKQSRQLTYQGNKNVHPRWSPNGKWLAFLASEENGAKTLKIISPFGGESRKLSRNGTSIHEFAWSPDGTSIAFVKTDLQAPSNFLKPKIVGAEVASDNIYLLSIHPPSNQVSKPIQLTFYSYLDQNCVKIGMLNWSPKGDNLTFSYEPAQKRAFWLYSKIASIQVKNKQITRIGRSRFPKNSSIFSPDGQSIAFMGYSKNQANVYVYHVKSRVEHQVAKTYDQLVRQLVGWSKDGQYLYVLERYHTYTRIIKLSVFQNKSPQLIGKSHQLIKFLNMSRDHKTLGFTMEDSTHPVEGYIHTLGTDHFSPEKVSKINADFYHYPLGKTKLIRWKSIDGLWIEGLLTYPLHYQKRKHYPLVVEIHGGPSNVFQERYIARPSVFPISLFSEKGYFYLRPNIRGSSGYGKVFRDANDMDWGGKDFEDVQSGIDFLIQKNMINPKKIGIQGWGYGGYMAAWAVTQSNRFKVASVGEGIIDLISYTGTNDLPEFVPNSLGGYFWNQPSLYLKRSPIFFVQQVKTPTLLQYGELARRVPKSQGFEFYRALNIRGIPTKMIIYPNTYLAILNPQMILESARINLSWFHRYLADNPHKK